MDVPLSLQELVVAAGVAVGVLVVANKALRDSKFGRCTSMPLVLCVTALSLLSLWNLIPADGKEQAHDTALHLSPRLVSFHYTAIGLIVVYLCLFDQWLNRRDRFTEPPDFSRYSAPRRPAATRHRRGKRSEPDRR